MKKLLLSLLSVSFILNLFSQEPLKYCGADELRISTLQKNPKIAEAVIKRDIELEAFTQKFVTDFYANRTSTATYIIPVVFHVIHNYGTENISDAQIKNGLDVLNKTFRKQLADTGSIVAAFKPLHADCDIEFRLAQLDPSGNCTSGINRIASSLTTVGDHSVKSLIQWPTNKYLNVYIVQNAAGLAGHCVWPADADSIPAWDGIVIAHDYVGTIGTSNYTRSVAFAHECGHYLNLQHIWGGNNVPGFYYYPCADPFKDCSIDDLVADTPPTIGWTSCNLSGASCLNPVDNVQNTMDYSYCNRMFTFGQKARMQACLNSPIAGRDNLWQTANLIATGVDTVPSPLCKAEFTSNKRVVCQGSGDVISFTNTSYNGSFTSILWTFPGGTPSSSTLASPLVYYTSPGKYNVTLKVVNGSDTAEISKSNFISVLPTTGTVYPFSESFEATPSLDGLEWFSNSFDTINAWQLTNTAAVSGSTSVMLNNFNNTMNTKDELFSNIINLTGATSLNISFKYAYAKKDSSSNDRLQVYVTSNCNTTWIQRLNLVGTALETAPITSSPFTPSSSSEWKQGVANIPGSYMTSNFRFKFVYTSSGGNNVYIDDINLDVNSGVEDLHSIENMFHLFPNPANEHVTISFSLTHSKNLSLSIMNIFGQKILEKGIENYSMGEHLVSIDTKNIAPGMYFLKVADDETNFLKPLIILAQ